VVEDLAKLLELPALARIRSAGLAAQSDAIEAPWQDDQVLEAAAAWCRRSHLEAEDGWTGRLAIRIAIRWALDPEAFAARELVLVGLGNSQPRVARPEELEPFTFPRRDVLVESRGAWVRRAWKAIQDEADAADRAARAAGFRLGKRRAGRIDWFVRYQVLGEGFTELAREARLRNPAASGRKTVAAAVRVASELLWIPLRRARPGPTGKRGSPAYGRPDSGSPGAQR
jgi:hypothetical protein